MYTDNRWVVTLSLALAPDLPNSLDRGSVERAGRLRRNDGTAGRKMTVRTHARTGTNFGVAPHGVLDDAVGCNDAIDESGIGAELATAADDGAALQDGAWIQRDVASELHGDVDEGLAWVEHGDAVEQPVPVGAGA